MAYRFDGPRLWAERERAGLERDEAGKVVDRSESTITLYEYGYRQPPPPILIELAELYGCDVRDFFVKVDEVPA